MYTIVLYSVVLLDLTMAKLLDDKPELATRLPRTTFLSPLLSMDAITYFSFREELEQIKQKLLELENREKVIVLRELAREEAKEEIRQLFRSGRTLYYSDIVKELKLDLKTVVEICNELEESGQIEVDAGARK